MYKRPKGTEDFLDTELRNTIRDSLSTVARSYGYSEVSTPAFESLDLLSKKEGEEITVYGVATAMQVVDITRAC